MRWTIIERQDIRKTYVKVGENKLGGYLDLLNELEDLRDFRRDLDSGHMQFLDAILYELAKYSKILSTEDDLTYSSQDYGKHLRHLYPSMAYRVFGLINIYSGAGYIERFYKKRGLKVLGHVEEDFISTMYFTRRHSRILDQNKVLIIEDRYNKALPKYYNLIGLENNKALIVYDGQVKEYELMSFRLAKMRSLYFDIDLDI